MHRLSADDSFDSDFFQRALRRYSLSLEKSVVGGIAVKRVFNKEGYVLFQGVVNTWNKFYFETKGKFFLPTN